LPVDNAYTCDWRVKKFKEEEKLLKETQKKAKEEAAKRQEEERERVGLVVGGSCTYLCDTPTPASPHTPHSPPHTHLRRDSWCWNKRGWLNLRRKKELEQR
jgi:hypothetical protein